MQSPNWWMMGLSFVLGLGLTVALMIRRVTREVPVSRPASAPLNEVKKPYLDTPVAEKPAPATTVTTTTVVETVAPVVEPAAEVSAAVIEPAHGVSADTAVTVVQADHSDGDTTMVIMGGDTVLPETTIRYVSSD